MIETLDLDYNDMQTIPPTNKSILITGCSSGIGQSTALHLAKSGYTVFATVRKPADAEQLRALQLPNLIPICPLDLTRPADISPAVEQVQAELARCGQNGLYAYINNAGGGSVSPVEMMEVDSFQRELQTRLSGPVALLQSVLPLLRAGKGRILWIMTPAIIPTPYVASIHTCDFAANCLVRTLAIELQPWQIPCIQIRCGGIKTANSEQKPGWIEVMMQHPRAALYRGALEKWARDIAAFDDQRTPPEKVAELIFQVLREAKPKASYSIGHMAGLAAVLEALPQSLADMILKKRFT
jgi:NAD(P)-dependent dehydrogenase (short-subunit alcohol dehydrogenase family)